MTFHLSCRSLITLLLVCSHVGCASEKPDSADDALKSLTYELSLNEGNLKIINLYQKQALIFRELAGAPDDQFVNRMVAEIYEPYKSFWAKYCCRNAPTFEHVVRSARASLETRIEERLPELLELDLNTLYENAAEKLHQMTGRTAKGTWYLVFSLGMTNLGAVGGGDMIIDFTHPETELQDLVLFMPHELTHQIMGLREGDPDEGTVLDRILSEGFATYVGYRFWGAEHTEAENLVYSEREWQWALENERRIFDKAREHLSSRDKADEQLFGDREARLFEGAPGAIGYFIGFRVIQAYVAKHGDESWVDLFDMPLKQILEQSGHGSMLILTHRPNPTGETTRS